MMESDRQRLFDKDDQPDAGFSGMIRGGAGKHGLQPMQLELANRVSHDTKVGEDSHDDAVQRPVRDQSNKEQVKKPNCLA